MPPTPNPVPAKNSEISSPRKRRKPSTPVGPVLATAYVFVSCTRPPTAIRMMPLSARVDVAARVAHARTAAVVGPVADGCDAVVLARPEERGQDGGGLEGAAELVHPGLERGP